MFLVVTDTQLTIIINNPLHSPIPVGIPPQSKPPLPHTPAQIVLRVVSSGREFPRSQCHTTTTTTTMTVETHFRIMLSSSATAAAIIEAVVFVNAG